VEIQLSGLADEGESAEMRAFTQHRGTVVAMDRSDVDTDQIIPKQFLKRIERTGFEDYLFYDWRYLDDGSPDPDFELNRPPAPGASILVARRNFGCGSSREHAVWALDNYGIRVVIAPSFADIFYNNCFKNGVLPIVLSEEEVESLFQRVQQHGAAGYSLLVDLEKQEIADDEGLRIPFCVDEFRRSNLLLGLDDIARTLELSERISSYEQQHAARLARN
jgi:3-isopropylmalate/(R)-2-methylmalate dehydratase small subunit